MTRYTLADRPKMLRETLCIAQTQLGLSPYAEDERRAHVARLQRLIDECDRHRPIDTGGSHGNLHTPTCGCDIARRERLLCWLRRRLESLSGEPRAGQ